MTPSSWPVSRIASSVDCTGTPYTSPAQPSSTVISSSRRSRPTPISSAVLRAIRPTWSRVFSSVAEASMPSTRRGRPPASSSAANPAIIPACVEPVTVQTTMVSKKTPSSSSCCGDLVGPAREAQPAEPVVGGAGRDGVRRTAAPLDVLERLPPRVAEADVEAGRVEPHLGAHDPAQQDVADLGAERVGPLRHPVLLHQHALQPEVRGHRGDLAGVVGLVATDRDQGVRALGQRLGDEVLQLAGLVAAVGEARVAVLALGPDLRRRRGGR